VVQLKKPIRERGEHEGHADEQEAATQKERSKEIILLLTDRSRTAPMNQRKAMPARPQHRRVRPVAEQAPPPHQSTSTDANFVPGTTQAPLDAVVDWDPAPVQQIVSQLIGSSEVTRSTGRDVVVGPPTIPSGSSCPVVASRSGAHVAARSILELQGPQGWVPLSDGLGHLAH